MGHSLVDSFYARPENRVNAAALLNGGCPVKPQRGVITALARGLSILECFTPERSELGPTEIAAQLKLPQPTVWRLCQTLQKLGFLVPGAHHGKFCVGEAVLRLGHAAASNTSLVEYAFPHMRDIAARFGASVSLSSRFGPDMLIVQRATGPNTLQLNLHVGSTYPVMNSAAGWAYLCALAPAERRTVIEEVRVESPKNFAAYRVNVKEALVQYESCGHVIALGKMHALVNAVGVPVVSTDRRRVMALNLGGVSAICTAELLGGPVADALKELAGKLGARLSLMAP
jgi:DNA-binding IclR family transcriptional regulator